jgi:uncharacterized protein
VTSDRGSASNGPLHLSVRGEARQAVPPDKAEISGRVMVTLTTKPDAVRVAGDLLGELTRRLGTLGGVPLTAETTRASLTWSAYSVTTHIEREHDPQTGRLQPTGRVVASVNVELAVRDFGLLGRMGGVLAHQEGFYVDGVSWCVDDDNPAWAGVRAAAIEAALQKGRDYARALGSSLTRVEHIADTGLLGGSGPGAPAFRAASRMSVGAGGPGEEWEPPSLDPVPQELTAVIEARFGASPVTIT